MNSDIAIQLAADILEDNFGGAAKRVGTVLLERGALSLQNLIRFVNEDEGVDVGRLRFVEVRNTLLTFVQHGLVVAKSSLPSEADSSRAIPQLYSMNLDEVLSRLHFSAFTEYVLWIFGEIPFQLVCVILMHGRAARSFMISEVQKRVKDDVSEEDITTDLQGLLSVGLVCLVPPLFVSEAGGASQAKADEDHQPGRRKRMLGEDPQEQQQLQAAQRPQDKDMVYTFSRSAFNLCLVKNLLCRIIEERTNQPFAGKVLAALLTSVRPAETGNRVNTDYMTLQDIKARMREMGLIEAQGRDHKTDEDAQKLIRYLNLLGPENRGQPEEEGVRLLKRRYLRSTATAVGGPPSEDCAAWAVDWSYASKTLMNAVTSHLIRDQFGVSGFRIFNLLNERTPPQKLEEAQIFRSCMLAHDTGREILNQMCRRHILQWQEVAKGGGARDQPMYGSFWLYYVDRKHVEMSVMHDVLQAILNLRVRFRTEVQKTVHLEGRPRSLTSGERSTLLKSYRSQDVLERSFLVLDSVLLVFRHFVT